MAEGYLSKKWNVASDLRSILNHSGQCSVPNWNKQCSQWNVQTVSKFYGRSLHQPSNYVILFLNSAKSNAPVNQYLNPLKGASHHGGSSGRKQHSGR